MRYAIVIENCNSGFRAYAPDLPDCVAEGESAGEARNRVRELIETDLRGIREDGVPVPAALALAEYVEV